MQGNLIDTSSITEEQKDIAEHQITEKQKISDYDIREYPIEVLVSKFTDKLENDEAEIYIPDYQREMIWPNKNKSRFIESILLNLPIPYLFCADDDDGRTEIIDGSQRMRTIVEFYQNGFELRNLELLTELNGFRFSDLPEKRQRRVKKKTIRLIELTNDMDEEARRQMFDRLNTGGKNLTSMEKRIGSKSGRFSDFLKKLSDPKNTPLFFELCPLSKARIKRREEQEFILRFFAYKDKYLDFDHSVEGFLSEYLDSMNDSDFDESKYEFEFNRMLEFVRCNFPIGFRKTPGNKSVPRIRFEAISVGVALALDENPDLVPGNIYDWINSQEFSLLTRSDASNNQGKLINRIHFVRDNLIGREVEYKGDPEKIFRDPKKIDVDQPDLFGGE